MRLAVAFEDATSEASRVIVAVNAAPGAPHVTARANVIRANPMIRAGGIDGIAE